MTSVPSEQEFAAIGPLVQEGLEELGALPVEQKTFCCSGYAKRFEIWFHPF
jgi:hypothetical protein